MAYVYKKLSNHSDYSRIKKLPRRKKKPKVINKEIKILDHIKPRTISLTEQCHRVVISLCSFFIRSPSIPIVLL